tara:strand:+ start:1455 stop:2432 length:978 start_codon:yes stop_codon:yes gene_type:complete
MKTIFTLQETIELIKQDQALMIAGDESLLTELPTGNWIGGTTAYFIGDEGGAVSKDQLFVITKSDNVEEVVVRDYDNASVQNFPMDGFANGISLIIIPAFSDIHQNYAKNVMEFEGIFDRPVAGWVSGVHLDEISEKSPKVVNGKTGEILEGNAVIAQLKLKDGIAPTMDIVNLFKQNDGDVITFSKTGFAGDVAFVNGEKVIFSEYLTKNEIDTKLPLVADFNGAMINVSFQEVDNDKGVVSFYAPVFEGVEYKIAKPVDNYVNEFNSEVCNIDENPFMSVNCILNFLYADLDGKQTGDIKGPITFGEIAYLLLNQTMVHVTTK